MGSLLTLPVARALVKTSLSDTQLEAVIDREESALVRRFGPHYVDGATTVAETLESTGENLFFRRRIGSVTAVVEDGAALTSDDYRLWGLQGRLERLPKGSKWGGLVTATYVPTNDNDERKAALIDLLRLTLERTAMKGESVAGEYSFQAPEWEAERRKIYRRLGFIGV